jgi:hypothetical protein
MRKLLSALVTVTFAVASLAPVAFAAEKGESVADACKGKKAGEEVMIDGKKVKCPTADAMKK